MALSCKKIKEKIFDDYPEVIFKKGNLTREKDGVVYLADDDYNPSTMVDLFNILHELGHVFTSNPEDARSEREWLATTWAISHMHEYGIKIPQWRKDNFQDDVYMWYDFELMLNMKHKKNKSALKLKWRD